MEIIPIEKLLINFKTLEDFKSFKESDHMELQMFEDLQAKIIENASNSPFYGIYYGDKLIARMCLYRSEKKFDRIFNGKLDFLDVAKLEVHPRYRKRGFGLKLINYTKSYNLPIVTRPKVNTEDFWSKMGFIPLTPINKLPEKLFIWYPDHLSEKRIN